MHVIFMCICKVYTYIFKYSLNPNLTGHHYLNLLSRLVHPSLLTKL